MDIVQKIGRSTAGKVVLAVIIIGGGIFSIYELRNAFGRDPVIRAANQRTFICSETGKSFVVNLEDLIGQAPPVQSPYSGKKTAYPAELCYWTADGKTKSVPTPVLLNGWIGKAEPTFCPDCNRLVVANNPAPIPNKPAPPTKTEWLATHSY